MIQVNPFVTNRIQLRNPHESTPRSNKIPQNQPNSNQILSKPSNFFQTHPNMWPFLHEFIELFQIQQTSTHICPLNPPQSFQAIPSLHKSKRIYWTPPRFTQTARIHKKIKQIQLSSPNQIDQSSSPNIPKSIRTHPNLPNRWNRIKSTQTNNK